MWQQLVQIKLVKLLCAIEFTEDFYLLQKLIRIAKLREEIKLDKNIHLAAVGNFFLLIHNKQINKRIELGIA